MSIKRHWRELIDFFESPLGRQIKYYAFFYLVLWGAHLILISLVSFFHLLLNHNIRTIGDWIGDRGWALIIISKLLIFYLSLQFVRLKSKKISSLRSYFRNSIQFPRKEIFVILFFLLIALIGVGRIAFNHIMIFEVERILFSIFGTLVFFSVDYILLIILEIFFPIQDSKQKAQKLALFPLLFYLFTYSTFIYEQSVSVKLYPFFFLLIYVGEWRRRNWTLPLLFLLIFLVPSYSLMGLDPVWSSSYSFFVMERPVSNLSLFTMVAIAIFYLERTIRNYPEYIYRD